MSPRVALGIVAAFALVAGACGGSSDEVATTTSSPATPTTTAATTTTAVTEDEGETTSSLLQTAWSVVEVGEGVKPVIALDAAGAPAIAYLLEARDGFVAYAAAANGWDPEQVASGYFYGPIGLTFDADGVPHIAYHDHQDVQVVNVLGDLTHAVRSGGTWQLEAAFDEGHDGWDSTIAAGPDGSIHAAGIDPQQFGSEDGVEYYSLGPDGWSVEQIGSGPVEYEWNVALAITPDGRPAVSFFDNNTQDLRYGELADGGWLIETVAESGDVGRFSSLAFDAAGRPHLSFYERTEGSTGNVLYATRTEGVWNVESVSTLSDVNIGFEGARRITSLAIDSAGLPHVVFSDETTISHASRDGEWTVETVATAAELPLGQLVTLALGADDTPHISTHVVTGNGPLVGTVVYLTP